MGAITGGRDWAYGMQLPVQTLTKTLADEWESDATPADLAAIAQKAEATGHSFVGVCDHIAIPDDVYSARMTTTWFDTVATLGFLSAHTSTIRLASTVFIAAYRHPLQTAKAFGTLDHLSGGRAVLGVGAGHVEGEFTALGVDYHQRGSITDEALECITSAFDSTHVSHEGTHFSYDEVGVAPRPPEGRLTVWVGGRARAAWRRAGRFGDGWIPMGNPPKQYPEIAETIAEAAGSAGRSGPFDMGYMPGWAHLTGSPVSGMGPVAHSTPEALAQEIRAARALGANLMHLKFRAGSLADHLEQFDAFAEVVVPMVEEP